MNRESLFIFANRATQRRGRKMGAWREDEGGDEFSSVDGMVVLCWVGEREKMEYPSSRANKN